MSNAIQFTDDNFKSEVLESDQPVLVDFWAAWCGPCRAVGPTIEELAKQFDGSVKVGKLNIDENPVAPSGFNIQSIPAVLLFKDGKVSRRLLAYNRRSGTSRRSKVWQPDKDSQMVGGQIEERADDDTRSRSLVAN